MRKNRNPRGQLENGKTSSELKPWDQKVLTNDEIKLVKSLMLKMKAAAEVIHDMEKCQIENEGCWPCEIDIRLEEGIVHHYPNGYYI
jgi:hypothetical protein